MGELVHVPFAAPARGPISATSEANASEQRGHNPAQEQKRLWRLAWAACPGIGWQRLRRLEGMFGSLEQAWQATAEELSHALSGSTQLSQREQQLLIAYRDSLGPQPIDEPPSPQQRRQWALPGCLIAGDKAYPPALLELERPPLRLFWQGQGALWPRLRARAEIGRAHV